MSEFSTTQVPVTDEMRDRARALVPLMKRGNPLIRSASNVFYVALCEGLSKLEAVHTQPSPRSTEED